MKKGSIIKVALLAGMTVAGFTAASEAADAGMLYRAYNPNTGEHLYTGNHNEIPFVVNAGWRDEGLAWQVPATGTPIYRMFNPNYGGDHHYTPNQEEVEMLMAAGWKFEGVAWHSGGSTPVHRLYNPNADTGTHHFTINGIEKDLLVKAGWRYEGVTMYSGPDKGPVPATPTPTEALGNSGILEEDLFVATKKAQTMWWDPNHKFYSDWFVDHENNPNKFWAFQSREIIMSNGERWYTIDFYVQYAS